MTLVHSNKLVKCLFVMFVVACMAVSPNSGWAKGKWDSVAATAPHYNKGVMLLLPDGSVLAKTSSGPDYSGSGWDRLRPDIHGSYKNGTWVSTSYMADSRLYFSSQVLPNGMVYAAGGEYGTGRTRGELFDPMYETWTSIYSPGVMDPKDTISDANSEILPDGRILQAVVSYKGGACNKIYIFDPKTGLYSAAPATKGLPNESVWLKLKDNSILFVDRNTTNAERYIPATNKWVSDSNVTVPLYDIYGLETGAASLLPDGRAFFIGSVSNTAFYTPSGDTTPGKWTTGPKIPDTMGAPDAAAAMMVNGKMLCAFSHVPEADSIFYKPMSFYEFDYTTNKFTRIQAPNGEDSSYSPAFFSNMLCLPDGNILYCSQGDDQYYIYTPDGAPLPVGKPTLSTVSLLTPHCDTFMATGQLFNGITEGASYGDDWQMNTNYPLIRLTSNDTVFYMQTLNWNSTGVCRGTLKDSQPDTTLFVFPPNVTIPDGTFSIQVVANGNASDPMPFDVCAKLGVNNTVRPVGSMNVYPNPADKLATVEFDSKSHGAYTLQVKDVFGRVVKDLKGHAVAGKNSLDVQLVGMPAGVYMIIVREGDDMYKAKLMVR